MLNRLLNFVLSLCLLLVVAGPAAAQSQMEIRLKSGSYWRGSINDTVVVQYDQGTTLEIRGRLLKVTDNFITIEGGLPGTNRKTTIYRGDLISMTTVEADAEPPATSRRTKKDARTARESAPGEPAPTRGVFVLPLEGPVGEDFRVDEIEMMGKEADRYGDGQIIVLDINSNGGRVTETVKITEVLRDIQKRHRVVAWVRKAISAGAWTAMCCDEIYFRTDGTCGSVSTIAGGSDVSVEVQLRDTEALVRVAERSGYHPSIARAMKMRQFMCSYTKDPVTGDVTFYDDMSGEVVLSDDKSNLTFNSSEALDCKFSKGTADTGEDLAALLDLPRWHEISDYGRRIAKDWQDTATRAREEIPRLSARRGYYKSSGTPEEQIGALIQIDRQLIRWWDRAPNIAETMIPPKEYFEREIEQLRKQLADMRRRD